MLKKVLLGLTIIVGIGILGFIGWNLMVLSVFGGFDKDYSISDLKENFEKNKIEIYELKRYFNEIVPKNNFVEIEYENDNTLGRFGIKTVDTTPGNSKGSTFLDWDLKVNSAKMDSLIEPMGWTRETLITLKDKLDKANCIHIESGEPTKIGFRRSGMGMYSFNVFDKPIPDDLIEIYSDSCTYVLVNKKLVLEYSGGAIGSQCFYNLK